MNIFFLILPYQLNIIKVINLYLVFCIYFVNASAIRCNEIKQFRSTQLLLNSLATYGPVLFVLTSFLLGVKNK